MSEEGKTPEEVVREHDINFTEVLVEAMDKQIDARLAECRELLGEEGQQFYLDHPEKGGLHRAYGIQGNQKYAVFEAVMHFVVGKPTFVFYFSQPELREGVIGQERPKIITP